MIQNVRIIGRVDPRVYHEPAEGIKQRGNPQFVMSLSELKLFAECPERWHDGYTVEPTWAMEWGELVDCLVTTPECWERRYAVCPKTYPSKGEEKPWRFGADYTDAWKQVQESQGKSVVKNAVAQEVAEAAVKIRHSRQCEFLLGISMTQQMLAYEWNDPRTGLVIPMKSLVDILPPKDDPQWGKCVADLKCVTDASREGFTDQIFRMKWHAQAALYRDALCAAGQDRTDFLWIACENYHPWQVAHHHASLEMLDAGQRLYQHWLSRYCQCLQSGQWDGYEAGAQQLIPGWSRLEFSKPWQLD